MTNTAITFQKQLNGYDKDEVDRYIAKLTGAYQTAYEEYTAICGKYNGLLSDYEKLCEKRDNGSQGVAVIAKTLIDTETLAQQIIADAQAEAGKLVSVARREAAQINLCAKRNYDQAEGSVRQAIGTLQKLLAAEPLDSNAENTKKLTFIPMHTVETAG